MENYVEDAGWGHIFWCTEVPNLPPFSLNFGGYWFEVKPEDYSIEVAANICALCLQSIDGYTEWILGDVFMRGWYSIHDYESNRMGFIPFPDSSKTIPEEYTEQQEDPEDNSNEGDGEGTTEDDTDTETVDPDTPDPDQPADEDTDESEVPIDDEPSKEEEFTIFGIGQDQFIAYVGGSVLVAVIGAWAFITYCYSVSKLKVRNTSLSILEIGGSGGNHRVSQHHL